jgi:sulfur carrier protein ThiS
MIDLTPESELLLPGEGLVRVAAAPHPFRVERQVLGLPAGLTLAEMLEAVQVDPLLRRHAHISVNGYPIPRENWGRVRPKPGAEVTIRVVPQGGGQGGKSTLAIVLSIAVLAASVALGSAGG